MQMRKARRRIREMIKRRSATNERLGWVLIGWVLDSVRRKQSLRGQMERGRDHQGGRVEKLLSADTETESKRSNGPYRSP